MRTRRVVLSLVTLTVVLISAAAGIAATTGFLRAPLGSDGTTTLLLLGADLGPPRSGSPLSARADAFHILVVAPDGRHATFLNLPRDAYVSVPGQGRSKINACLVAGPDNCVATVRQNWGIQVDAWFVTSMDGLKAGVEEFGGVQVDVPLPLSDGGADINSVGEQRLTGSQALTFARDRKNRPDGDFGRSEAQAALLQAAHRQLISGGVSVQRVADVIGTVRRTTATNASPQQLLRMGYLGATIPPDNIDNVNVPGNVGSAGAASVVFLPESAGALIQDVATDGVVGTR